MHKIVITMGEAYRGSGNEECALVQFEEMNGVKRSRYVTMESLLSAFKASIVREEKLFPVGELPFGYYDARIGELEGGMSVDLVAVLPPGRQMMRYEDTMYDVCMPGIVFSFRVRKERIVETYVYVIKDEKPSEKSQLYQFPFGNVSTAGKVCWGGNQLPRIRSLKDLEEAMILFIQSPTNSDYYHGKSYCNHEKLTLRELFEFLKDQERYPDDYLVALKMGRKKRCLKELTPWRTKK